MLQEWKAMEKPEEEEIKARLAAAKEKLAKQQLLIKEQKIPVLVLMEGWGTAGKGSVIGQVIQNIDPRFFKVESMGEKSEEERRKPFLYRYFKRIPEEGKFVFLDSGWMDEIVKDELHGKLSDEDYAKRIESVRRFERQLTDNGYLVMKFFLHISEKEQAKRIEHLEHEKDTVWRVSKNDLWQNRHYEKCEEAFSSYMKNTNMPSAPWYIPRSSPSPSSPGWTSTSPAALPTGRPSWTPGPTPTAPETPTSPWTPTGTSSRGG